MTLHTWQFKIYVGSERVDGGFRISFSAHYCRKTQMQSTMFKFIGYHVTPLFKKKILIIKNIFSKTNCKNNNQKYLTDFAASKKITLSTLESTSNDDVN